MLLSKITINNYLFIMFIMHINLIITLKIEYLYQYNQHLYFKIFLIYNTFENY